MGSLMFMVCGILFIGISRIAKKTRKKFIAESFLVAGKVVEIKESLQMSGDSKKTFWLPIIEYKVGSFFRFQAELDANQHHLQIGDSVSVMVSNGNRKVAKLQQSTKELYLLLNLMLVLGVAACGFSVYLFDKNNFSMNPFVASMVFISILTALLMLYPIVKNVIDNGPSYVENAYEVAEGES